MATNTLEVVTPRPLRAPRERRRRRGPSVAYAFLALWMIGALLLTIGPMLASLYLSFTSYDLFTSPKWIALDNYRRMFTADPDYLASVKATLMYVVLAVPLKLIGALGVALLLNRERRGKGFYRSAFYAPSLLGASVSVALVWRSVFGDGGSVDRLSAAVGLHSGGWISNPSYALLTLVILSVWQFGAPMIIFLAGLKQIPPQLYEAAALDGAGKFRSFISVTLPLLTPVIFFNLVLEVIHSFQVFTAAYVISDGRGGPVGSTLFYTLYIYQRGFTQFQMGYASAMAWVLLLVVGLVSGILFLTARSWVFYSGGEAK